MMKWNHRVICHPDETKEIVEMYYVDGELLGWNSCAVIEESKKDMKRTMKRMRKALDKPIIYVDKDGMFSEGI